MTFNPENSGFDPRGIFKMILKAYYTRYGNLAGPAEIAQAVEEWGFCDGVGGSILDVCVDAAVGAGIAWFLKWIFDKINDEGKEYLSTNIAVNMSYSGHVGDKIPIGITLKYNNGNGYENIPDGTYSIFIDGEEYKVDFEDGKSINLIYEIKGSKVDVIVILFHTLEYKKNHYYLESNTFAQVNWDRMPTKTVVTSDSVSARKGQNINIYFKTSGNVDGNPPISAGNYNVTIVEDGKFFDNELIYFNNTGEAIYPYTIQSDGPFKESIEGIFSGTSIYESSKESFDIMVYSADDYSSISWNKIKNSFLSSNIGLKSITKNIFA